VTSNARNTRTRINAGLAILGATLVVIGLVADHLGRTGLYSATLLVGLVVIPLYIMRQLLSEAKGRGRPSVSPVVKAGQRLAQLRSANTMDAFRRTWWNFIEHPYLKAAWAASLFSGFVVAAVFRTPVLILLALIALSAGLACGLWLDTVALWSRRRDRMGAVATAAFATLLLGMAFIAIHQLLSG
jgi:hypothetical protein